MAKPDLLERHAQQAAATPESRAEAADIAATKAEKAADAAEEHAIKAQCQADQARLQAATARRAAEYTAHLAGARIAENAPPPIRLGIGGNGQTTRPRTLTAEFDPTRPP